MPSVKLESLMLYYSFDLELVDNLFVYYDIMFRNSKCVVVGRFLRVLFDYKTRPCFKKI